LLLTFSFLLLRWTFELLELDESLSDSWLKLDAESDLEQTRVSLFSTGKVPDAFAFSRVRTLKKGIDIRKYLNPEK